MTTTRDDGGRAFPSVPLTVRNDDYGGMSLREWFAGQALAGMHARGDYDSGLATPEQRAAAAYRDADAMLAERAKP